jgi:MFS family permease
MALGYVGSTFQLTMARVFQGIASAGIAAPAFAVAADLSRKGGEGRQMSLITLGFGLGIGLGPLLAGLLVGFSFQMPFLVMGAFCLLAAWVVSRFVPETVSHQKGPAAAESMQEAKSTQSGS